MGFLSLTVNVSVTLILTLKIFCPSWVTLKICGNDKVEDFLNSLNVLVILIVATVVSSSFFHEEVTLEILKTFAYGIQVMDFLKNFCLFLRVVVVVNEI
jgi:hypothetical protein